MRVGLQTWGTEGDVRPFFALGHALRARGHEVEIVYTNVEGRDFGALASKCGLTATDVGSAYFRENRERLGPRARASFELRNPLEQVRRIVEDLMDPVADAMFDAGDTLAQRCDVMVNHFITHPAHTAADKHARPIVLLALAPIFASRSYAPVGMPDLGRLFNPLGWKLAGRVLESVFRDRVNHVRARAGLPAIRGIHENSLARSRLALVAVSPALFARPADWEPQAQLSGFLTLPEIAEPWEPEPELAEFLASGPPPMFQSFGSMFSIDEHRTAGVVRTLAEAATLSGMRSIIQAPDAATRDAPRSAAVHYIVRAPHAELFPRCSLVVHHGGAGTTQSALLAGRASIVVPHAADQFFWGDLLRRRGVAAKPLKSRALTPARLAARMRDVAAHPEMATRAEVLGRALAMERGPERAAELIERAMSRV